jgi:hypothetical protein
MRNRTIFGVLGGISMRLASLAFLVVLIVAHVTGDPVKILALPLSTFRDGPARPYGLLLFLLLLLTSFQMLRALHRAGRDGHAFYLGVAAFFLLLVALTRSEDGFHLLCSFVVLALLYVYYAVVLGKVGLVCQVGHLLVPLLLVGITQLHSYGLWQKSLIVYFLLAANGEYSFLHRPVPRSGKPFPRRRHADEWQSRRRVVYLVGSSRDWSRKKPVGSRS